MGMIRVDILVFLVLFVVLQKARGVRKYFTVNNKCIKLPFDLDP
jgi:hypothetical protein